MPQYYFVLGRENALAQAEIQAWCEREKLTIKKTQTIGGIFLVEADNLPVKRMMSELGGTIKIGAINGQVKKITAESLAGFLEAEAGSKINFSFSPYNFSLDVGQLGSQMKRYLKDQGVSARFVASKTYPLSTVIVAKNKLLTNGAELVLIKTADGFLIGRTEAVQNFELFNKLDYGRPAADPKKGMLPPKLAQIMINLSGIKKSGALLDPFCGAGTVLQQAAVLGFNKLAGSDLDQKAITMTKTNLAWLKKEFSLNFDLTLKNINAVNLDKNFSADSFFAIVTEPDLGPALTGRETLEQIKINCARLENLYSQFLRVAAIILKSGGSLVMAIPEFKSAQGSISPNTSKILPSKLKLTAAWTYGRDDQHLIRKICRFEKK